MAVVPAENSGKFPFVYVTVEAVSEELVDHLALFVSQVPLVEADAPLLSHHTLTATALWAVRTSAKHKLAAKNAYVFLLRVFTMYVGCSTMQFVKMESVLMI
jgi:hypothetical protein